jgi:DNA primase
MKIDIQNILDQFDIDYKTSGKNIGRGWIGIEECPFCGGGGFHCGIKSSGCGFSCFICGEKGGIVKLLLRLLKIPYFRIQELIQSNSIKYYKASEVTFREVPIIKIPGTTTLSPALKLYLKNRNLDAEYIQHNFGIFDGDITGDYKYRIIIPIYFYNELVTFIGRDYTGKQTLRYKNYPSELSKLSTGEILYGFDELGDDCIVTEGVFDKWNIGINCCAALGVVITSEQIKLLLSKKRILILFDNGKAGQEKAEQLYSILTFAGKDVINGKLPSTVDDPAELSQKEIYHIKQQYGF